jgi:hypothetical protein
VVVELVSGLLEVLARGDFVSEPFFELVDGVVVSLLSLVLLVLFVGFYLK